MKLSKGVLTVVVIMVIAIIAVVAFPAQSEDAVADNLAPAHPLAPGAQTLTPGGPANPLSKSFSEVFASQHKQAQELRWARNPFRAPENTVAVSKPRLSEGSDSNQLRLSGISTIQNDKMAIIDRQIVGKGDRLRSGHLVVQVTDDSVELVLNDIMTTLTLEK